jgi:diguanylate cyclase (GGDEF)-like protein
VEKNKITLWLVIIFLTILPIGLDRILFLHNFNFPIIWTIYILPCALITVFYPSWKVVILSGVIFSLIKYTVVIIGHRWWDIFGILMHVGSSILAWIILLSLAYFRINYEKLLQEVNYKALIDPLTEIYNRRHFDECLKEAVNLRDNPSLVLIMLDIDFFKRVNDTYGHVCGDLALQHVTRIIKQNVRESDVLARMGGEEFAVIFSDTSLEEGKKICERIREAVEKTEFIYKNQPIYLTISIGMSQHHGETFYEFIDKADQALFEAKERGRNRLVVA